MSDRVAPYSEEAERGVLGAVLLNSGEVLSELVGKWKFCPEMFWVPAHRVIFEAMVEVGRNAWGVVDVLTVSAWLAGNGKQEAAGGALGLDPLIDGTPTWRNFGAYAEVVVEKFRLRRVLETARVLQGACYEGRPAGEIISEGMAGLDAVAGEVLDQGRSNAEVFDALVGNWERAHDMRSRNEVFFPGLVTPFRRLNEILGGYQPGLHLIGGKSSAGKTSFALNVCNGFLLNGKPGLMIQLDDTHEDVVGRLVSMVAGVSLPALSQGFAKHDSLVKIKEEIRGAIAGMKLHVVEECEGMEHARALARYHKARHGIEWVMVDYVQVLDADGNARDDERQRLGKIAVGLKRLWKELRVPVLALSQVSKFKDSDDDGLRADMSDLFGASELFHAASSVMILKQVRQRVNEMGELVQRGGSLLPIEWAIDATGYTKRHAVAGHVVKNKHGPRDCMVMFWALMKYFQFTETQFVREGGVDRQRTWEEDVGAGDGEGEVSG